MVFPLGMYATCTYELAKDLGLAFLLPISQAFTALALAAWAILFVGLLRVLATALAAELRGSSGS